MRTDLPSGTVTLLLTDIQGSTRLLQRLGADGYAAALGTHRDLLRTAFARHDGAEVDTQGDAFFVAFPTALGAVCAAIDCQRALASHPWPADAPMAVRMGLHTGEPTRTDEGYVGIAVNTAARIASAGHGGQILMSAATAALVRDELEREGITQRDLGMHRLKDLEGTHQIYQPMVPGLASDFSPPRSLQTHPNNLPTPATPFVGRGGQVAAVRDLLLNDSVRLVTVTGPGGAGKSRLTLRVATELLHRFKDGVFFVPLATITDASRVINAIASTMDVREEQGLPLAQSVVAALKERDLLLLMDNFEQVQAAARDVGELLKACPRMKILVSSREALRVGGAKEFRIPPLELPPPGRLPDLNRVKQFEAVRLFLERAQTARPDFEITVDNVADVVAIIRRVDALPLAIELAAARIRTLAPQRLLGALNKRLKVLTGGTADLLDHQQTLRDLIAWSYDLLSDEEKVLWQRMAIFSGGCTADAAQQVCDIDNSIEVELDAESLVTKSLLTIEFEGTGAEKVISGHDEGARFSMLETLREFAFEQLEESGEAPALRERHWNWCVSLAERAEPHFRGPKGVIWIDRLEREQENFRVAMIRCVEDPSRGADSALRMAAALWFFWYERGHLSEGRQWTMQALAATTNASPALRAGAYYGAASLARQQNLLAEAEQLCTSAIDLFRSVNDEFGVAKGLSQLGAVVQRLGDYERASSILEEALALLRVHGDVERISFTLIALGALKQITGKLDEAAHHYEESLGIGRARDDGNAIATALVNLGEVHHLRGDLDAAARYYRESLSIYRELGLKIAIAYCLEVLAGIGLDREGTTRAPELLAAAEALREEIAAPVEPFNKERLERDIARAAATCGNDFKPAWQRGRELDTDAAVALALRED